MAAGAVMLFQADQGQIVIHQGGIAAGIERPAQIGAGVGIALLAQVQEAAVEGSGGEVGVPTARRACSRSRHGHSARAPPRPGRDCSSRPRSRGPARCKPGRR